MGCDEIIFNSIYVYNMQYDGPTSFVSAPFQCRVVLFCIGVSGPPWEELKKDGFAQGRVFWELGKVT